MAEAFVCGRVEQLAEDVALDVAITDLLRGLRLEFDAGRVRWPPPEEGTKLPVREVAQGTWRGVRVGPY